MAQGTGQSQAAQAARRQLQDTDIYQEREGAEVVKEDSEGRTGKNKFYSSRHNKVADKAAADSEQSRTVNAITGRAEKNTGVRQPARKMPGEEAEAEAAEPNDSVDEAEERIGVRRRLHSSRDYENAAEMPDEDESLTEDSGKEAGSEHRGKPHRFLAGRRSRSEEKPHIAKDDPSYVAMYTPETVMDYAREFRVPKDSISIVIDSYRAQDVYKTPALCWKKKNTVSFMLLEPEPRVISMPFESFSQVIYHRNVPEEDMGTYDNYRKNMGAYPMFASSMPKYNQAPPKLGEDTYTQNLYSLGDGMEITAGSLKALMKRFDFDLTIFDTFNLKEKYSDYFKDAYEQRILLNDGIYGQSEYTDAIRHILLDMVDDDSYGTFEFDSDIDQMIRYRLITADYGTFYRNRKYDRVQGLQ